MGDILVEQKGCRVWCEYGGIDDQDQYDPIPDCFEWRVVEYGEIAITKLFQSITLIIIVQ